MKFLILRCNDMAWHMTNLYLKEQGHDVLGFALLKSHLVESVVGDTKEEAFMRDMIGINRFDTVINCIGILNQFADKDKTMATYLNACFPHQLAKLTEGTDT